ncbi:MAG: RNA polymerase sigma factor [Saprospiraceae bacterium]|nr:RNA polymerase sigma factor [Saprospiraceae bacterium]MBK8450306.1 RNA polymerase sigma factor [Saprospiraceae bacterium]MBK8485604.1 RNA polymerase sigma factor [Saprospiraceae bacterium]MBK9222833.1 RNA polymerase sigma factor [Saprospiraceae bacterium]MBK9720126.1 RNA polymerase sigma factor [Saprospiraceae bacterium]
MAGNTILEDQIILEWISKPESLEKGFRALVEKFQQKLYWHIRRMVLSHDDADDVLQNTFIKVYRSIEQFEQKSSLFTWLYRIATNESLTFIERNKKFQYDFVENQEEHPAISQLKADPYFDGDQIQLHLQEALTRLPEKQKQVFLLRYHDEMSYKEMSEVLQTSEGALKASYHHAIKKIEDYFKIKELI